MEQEGLFQLIVLLSLAVVAIAYLKRFQIASIIAYLLVGLVVGPHSLGFIDDTRTLHILAEFGVVFLMFTVGLEFSFPKFWTLRREVLGLGGAQVLITALIGGVIVWYFTHDIDETIVVGGIVALSSTAIVIKQLVDQLELNSRHGHLAISILIFQDLAVIPLLLIIPTLSPGETNGSLFDLAQFLSGLLALTGLLAIGHWILRPLLREIGQARSPELFTLSVILISLSAAWATYEIGLSLALGAFIAGMMLSETEYRHQIEVEIRPFRDIFLGIFFITVGMLLNIRELIPLLPLILGLTLGLMLFKTILIMALSVLFGANIGVAFRTGLILNQGSEFGFAILTLAVTSHVISDTTAQVVLSVIILSMLAAPSLIAKNGLLAKKIIGSRYKSQKDSISETLKLSDTTLTDHIILCGYGRISQSIVRFVEDETSNYIAIDLDAKRIQEAQLAGENVFYGDASNPNILKTLGIDKANVVVITIKDPGVTREIIDNTRRQRSDIPILVRTHDERVMDELYEIGATEVVPESMEAALIMASHLLLTLRTPMSKIARKINLARKNKYRFLRGYFPGEEASHRESALFNEHMDTITIPAGAKCVGKMISDLKLDQYGVVLTALRRAGIRGTQPSQNLVLREQDILVMYGTPEELEIARNELL